MLLIEGDSSDVVAFLLFHKYDCEILHLNYRVLSYYRVNQFLLVALFFIGPIISVARVERTGAWEVDLVN